MKKKSPLFYILIFSSFILIGWGWNSIIKKVNSKDKQNTIDNSENIKVISQIKNRIISSTIEAQNNLNVNLKILNKLDSNNQNKVVQEVQKAQRAIQNIQSGRIDKPRTQLKFESSDLVSESILELTPWKRIKNVQIRDFSESSLDSIQNSIFKFGKWVFLKADAKWESNESFQYFNTQKPLPVFDTRLSQIGFVTGNIVVISINKNSLLDFLVIFDAEIVNSFENINTYYITSKKKIFNLEELYKQAQSKFGSDFVNLEINNKKYVKN